MINQIQSENMSTTITAAPHTGSYTFPLNSNTIFTYNSPGTASYDISSSFAYTQDKALKVEGDAIFEGEVCIKGVNLSDRLDKIEERLGILHPNEKLEEKWENLRGLRNAYLELEKEIIEKEKIWATLKK